MTESIDLVDENPVVPKFNLDVRIDDDGVHLDVSLWRMAFTINLKTETLAQLRAAVESLLNLLKEALLAARGTA